MNTTHIVLGDVGVVALLAGYEALDYPLQKNVTDLQVGDLLLVQRAKLAVLTDAFLGESEVSLGLVADDPRVHEGDVLQDLKTRSEKFT